MVTFRVSDMTCGHCASSITRAIASVDQSARIDVDVPSRLVRITGTADEAELSAAIVEAGYTPQKAEEAIQQRKVGGCCCG